MNRMKIQQNIKHNLRFVMAERKITLAEFADELGIARSSLQCYLDGTSNPRADTIQLLAEKLDIPVHALVADFPFEDLSSDQQNSLPLSELRDALKEVSEYSYKLHLLCEALSDLVSNVSPSEDD